MSGDKARRTSASADEARVFGALLGATSPAAAHGKPAPQLLKTYQPVLVLHPQELFRPTKVQPFIADSELERFVGSNPQQLPLDPFWSVIDPDPGPGELGHLAPGSFYRLDQTACEADATVRPRGAHRDTHRSSELALLLRQPTDPSPDACRDLLAVARGGLGGRQRQPRLLERTARGRLQPTLLWSAEGVGERREVTCRKHPSGRVCGPRLPFELLRAGIRSPRRDSDQPRLHPSRDPAVSPLLPFLQVVDQVLAGSRVEAAKIRKIEGKSWSMFPGRWGESEYFFTPIALGPVPARTAVPVGLAPASPPNQGKWNPATVLGWPLVP